MLQRLDNIITSIETLAVPTQQTTKGTLLEVCFHETVLMRLQTAYNAEKRTSLNQLLSIGIDNLGENQALQAIMKMELDKLWKCFDEKQGLPSLKTDTHAFLNYLGKASIKSGFYAAAPGDCFDYLLMVKLEGRKQPFFVFFNVQSLSHPSDTKYNLPKEFALAEELETFSRQTRVGSNESSANLFDFNNILYVYATGYEGKSSLVDWNEMEGSSGVPHKLTTLVMRNDEMNSFMGLTRDLYLIGRQALDNKVAA
jgi:hypothetical protein